MLQRISQLYASFFRGTPILIQLFLFYYGLPEMLKLVHIDISRAPVLCFVILTYGLHTGAYVSETIRAAVTSVDRGQVEAAYSVGMTGVSSFHPHRLAAGFGDRGARSLERRSRAAERYVACLSLGVMEMTGKSQTLASLTNHFIESYISLALIYLVISFILERLLLCWNGGCCGMRAGRRKRIRCSDASGSAASANFSPANADVAIQRGGERNEAGSIFYLDGFVKLLPADSDTLLITAVSVLCGFVIGTIVALIRIYKVPVLHPIASAYVTFIRGTPMLTHLLIIYFGLPMIIDGVSAQLRTWLSIRYPFR